MELKLFAFIEDVITRLDEMKPKLEEISQEIENFFETFLESTNKGYISIDSRVKSKKSLKEKIIRNHYYQKYDTKEKLFENVPDVIGIRIGCKFVEDENGIYKFIKKYFNEKSEAYEGYFYTTINERILLSLSEKQPQEQKNGMKIFRIDGKYVTETGFVNFELQVKSLVNIFWSEIEHKIIYKNYNYVIEDKFYKDIMKSIKNSLTTIDQQLLLIANQFSQSPDGIPESREDQLEKLVSKMIYDIFAERMRESIGVLVDFRKSCEAIVMYVFRGEIGESLDNYNKNLLVGLEKVRNIDKKSIDFRQKIIFERKPVFKEEYTGIMGEHIGKYLNEEFQWNLFFRILFEIEEEDNAGDFENFMCYYTEKFYGKLISGKLFGNFTMEETDCILDTLMVKYAEFFVIFNSVELLYDNVADQVVKIVNSIIEALYKNVITFEQWEKEKDIYLNLLEIKLYMYFNMDVNSDKILNFLERVRVTKSNIEAPKGMFKYIYKL